MIHVVASISAAFSNKKGGIYARDVSGRVLVGGGVGLAAKKSGADGGQAHIEGRRSGEIDAMWIDEAVVVNGGFLRFSMADMGIVAWGPSHGLTQSIENVVIYDRCRLITNLHHGASIVAIGWSPPLAAGGGRGGLPPHRAAFLLSYPHRARQSQPMQYSRPSRPDPVMPSLKDQWKPVAKHGQGKMGSGVRFVPWSRISAARGATGSTEPLGQGAKVTVLMRGGTQAVTLGGGAGHVNGA